MKILHAADLHLRENDLSEAMVCCKKLLITAREEKPDLIVSAGDIYHHREIKVDSEVFRYSLDLFKNLADICPVAVVTGTPLHEGKAPLSLRNCSTDHTVWVSSYPEQLALFTPEVSPRLAPLAHIGDKRPMAILSMVPTPTKQNMQVSDDEISSALTPMFAGFGAMPSAVDAPHILVGHFSVRGAAISESQQMIGKDIEVGRDQIALANADVACLGHIHKSQFIEPNIYYSGSIYRTNIGETEPKGFMIHNLYDEYRESNFIETPAQKAVKRVDDFTVGEGPEFFSPPSDVIDAHVRYEIRIYQDHAEHYNREEIEKMILAAGAKSADVRIIRVPRETTRAESQKLMESESLRDKVKILGESRGEDVPESILVKADNAESMSEEELLKEVSGR